MRKISANYIFPINREPLHNGILIIDDNGFITDIEDTGGKLKDSEKLEFYNGILVPGFVNAHCHLELSHMKGIIPRQKGIDGFVDGIVNYRQGYTEEYLRSIESGDRQMIAEGIVAVGDVSNTNHTFKKKQQSKIAYHTFIEIFNFDERKAEKTFNKGYEFFKKITGTFLLPASIVPHAPHTVSKSLLSLIKNHAEKTGNIISYHNQESEAENELFLRKSGKLYRKLKEQGFDYTDWEPSGLTSLKTIGPLLPAKNRTLLIHNTVSKEEDIEFASGYFTDLYWVFCPNSNLYIENTLPDIPLFIKKKQKITIGTDSLASNDRLSILEELKTVNKAFPQIPLSEIIKWATRNGAEALGFDDKLGSFETGKKPGINLIENADLQNLKLTEKSSVKVLL
ncbi:MAG: amidohydrolase family protein [Bacteroidia bacterium]|nr:amidohydrolase family protein [Bacteroidia bacterium]